MRKGAKLKSSKSSAREWRRLPLFSCLLVLGAAGILRDSDGTYAPNPAGSRRAQNLQKMPAKPARKATPRCDARRHVFEGPVAIRRAPTCGQPAAPCLRSGRLHLRCGRITGYGSSSSNSSRDSRSKRIGLSMASARYSHSPSEFLPSPAEVRWLI